MPRSAHLNDEIAAEREASSSGAGLGSYGARGRGAESGYSSPVDLARAAGGIPPFGQYGGK